jgi:hypothetical protein
VIVGSPPRKTCLVVMAAVVLTTGRALAAREGPGPVRISIDDCADADLAEITRLIDLEVGVSREPGLVRVAIECNGGQVMLEVGDPTSGRRSSRTLRLDRTAAEARARLVALAAVELAATVVSEPPAPAPAVAPPPAIARLREVAPPRGPDDELSWRLLAGVGGARFFSRLATTTSAGLKLCYDGWRVLDASAEIEGSFGSGSRSRRSASAAWLSLSPLLGAHRRLGRFTTRAVTGPRLALARLQADATLPGDQAGSFTAPWAGWLAKVGLGRSFGSRIAVELAGEVGHVLSPIGGRIAGDREIAVEGAWIGASLSAGARF